MLPRSSPKCHATTQVTARTLSLFNHCRFRQQNRPPDFNKSVARHSKKHNTVNPFYKQTQHFLTAAKTLNTASQSTGQQHRPRTHSIAFQYCASFRGLLGTILACLLARLSVFLVAFVRLLMGLCSCLLLLRYGTVLGTYYPHWHFSLACYWAVFFPDTNMALS